MKKTILAFTTISFISIHSFAQDLVATKTGPPGTWQELGTLTVKRYSES
jgi:hypothetical protein